MNGRLLRILAAAAACPLRALPAPAADEAETCLSCHADKSLTMTRAGGEVSLHVDPAAFTNSPHADQGCTGCHEGFKTDEIPHADPIRPVDCSGCHADAQKEYAGSDHGRARAAGVRGAPGCASCHPPHGAAGDAGQTPHQRQSALCLHCHLDDPAVRERVSASARFVASFESSVHGQSARPDAAACTDCHGAHGLRKGADPASSVSKLRIAATCGKCHDKVREQFEASIHGSALARGVTDAPTCTGCHGEHAILSPRDEKSPTAPRNLSAQVCSGCHSSVRLAAKYGLASDRFRSFEDSYHGLAGRAGSVEAANCASCHGVHDILPSSDPRSSIHKDRLAATCGQCHPGANENFTKGSVHVDVSPGGDRVLFWVTAIYLGLIVIVIGGMLVHNALDFVKKARVQLLIRRGLLPAKVCPPRLYLRMTRSERLQHGALVLSFVALVVTGFALRFPESWWVAPFARLSPRMFELRAFIHRAAGLVMILTSLYHLVYVIRGARGRKLIRDLWPVKRDFSDAVDALLYYLGARRERPRFGRFSYVEKSEYWALVWGTVVMAATGVILAFDNASLGLLTKLGVDVARTVHFWEAWLATLAILVWHIYFVVFNPDVYPLNLAFWTGTLTEEEMEAEHPLELEEILKHRGEAGAEQPISADRRAGA